MSAALLVTVAACGGGGAREAPFTVSLPDVSFPARQYVATPTALRIAVRNDGDRALPNVAVSIDSFAAVDPQAALQNARESIWLVDRAPGVGTGDGSAADQTWALGRLAPRTTTTFVWRVTPVRPGRFTVSYRVTAGSAGRAATELPGGRPPRGVLAVTISRAPADPRVDPATGRVIRRPRAHL